MIAWAKPHPNRGTYCTGDDDFAYLISTVEQDVLKTLMDAMKKPRPPVVHERQMKPLPAREYVIPYNRKMLMQQFKQSRRG